MEVFGVKMTDYGGEALAALFVILVFLQVWVPGRALHSWRRHAERSADQVDRLLVAIEPMTKFVKELRELKEFRDLEEYRRRAEQEAREKGDEP